MSEPATAWDELRGALAARPSTWLVTGAAGFIGSALVEELLRLGQRVVGLDNFSTGHRANLADVATAVGEAVAERFRLIEGDLLDLDACRAACAGVELVLHQAALGSVPRSIKDPIASHRANVDGFLHLMVAARDAGVRRVVYASSSSVYGDHPGLPKVEDQLGRPLSPYAATKRVDEIYAAMVQDVYRLETVGLRYFNVYGRRQDPEGVYAAVIPRWIARLVRGERCEIFGDGSASRDFCYVDNAVQANLLAAATGGPATTNQVYNVGCRGQTSVLELHAMLQGAVAARRPAARGLEPVFAPPRPGDVQHSLADIDKIGAAFGYRPSHDVDAGLVETVDWFLARL
jgi:UDP-N-acetylglucosamine/UDP-N-acetylgalactosamine 4-epimerase